MKITHFLKALLRRHINFEYIPVDISKDALDNLFTTIRTTLPEAHFTISAIAGEYLPALQHVLKTFPNRRNAIVFLGSNLGNFSPPQIPRFLSSLSAPLSSGDLLLLGCDLQKDMSTMLSAYNDSRGVTRDFNLNLLTRINRELGANFHLANFSYHSTFNSHTSAIESYIISSIDQTVSLNPIHEIVPDTSSTVTLPARQFSFKAGDAINTETSQKYTSDFLRKILYSSGFTVAEMFMDRRAWFTDIVARVR